VDSFLDIHSGSLTKNGEQLCGDKVQVFSSPERAIVVLSDGLGSGVKANILATMTTSIIVTMLRADVALLEVMNTVIGSLPIDRVRQVAYSTFTIVDVDKRTNAFRLINYDNPPPLLFRRGKLVDLPTRTEILLGRKIEIGEGTLERGDFVGAISDGVVYAGVGLQMNFGWGRSSVAHFVEGLFRTQPDSARGLVRGLLAKTNILYAGKPGDDATVAGVYVREKHRLIVFTGPPIEHSADDAIVQRFLAFPGRKVVAGGSTGNIVARYIGEEIEPDLTTMRDDVPPIGRLTGVDLVTEGMLTLSGALELLRTSYGDLYRVPFDDNGAALLARELLLADETTFLVGATINPYYQNPLLPRSISIRRNLVENIAETLQSLHKDVRIEYC
jgi:hypothetical protein